ncbi:MAG: AMP-binding protein, partial [Prevotella sp.]|nr:AMP-binding protein [Prevotella sp.]
MGIIKAGCFYVPLSDSYPKERLRHIITDSGMQRLVTTRSLLKDVEGLVPSVRICLMEDMLNSSLADAQHSSLFTLHSSRSSSTPAYMLFTSGTTGQPK